MSVLRRSHQEPGEVQSVVTQEVQKLYDAVRLARAFSRLVESEDYP